MQSAFGLKKLHSRTVSEHYKNITKIEHLKAKKVKNMVTT